MAVSNHCRAPTIGCRTHVEYSPEPGGVQTQACEADPKPGSRSMWAIPAIQVRSPGEDSSCCGEVTTGESPRVVTHAQYVAAYLADMQTNEGGGVGENYEIRLKGHLEPRWADWFDGLTLTRESDGTTVFSGSVMDQAALHGLLGKVRDLGLPLIAVRRRTD